MADLASITSLETLISTVAGKHESAAVKADIALAGNALSLLVNALVPNLAPGVDLSGIDAGLSKAFDGITAVISAAEGSITNTETAANA
ncbi:hypothetical protein [Acetobacter sp. DsW_063]|uniref:hypothetical protein n=1 Tax=Acetobacter sp. DsW_063 TaxID=1514894 RepID=UPI000A36308C|nr:hypothetical protein [Acetobacter sp. DsW_063]OUJ16476.1 hypothetical protein HK28_12410 [Acetobacter sp. DsW_063]